MNRRIFAKAALAALFVVAYSLTSSLHALEPGQATLAEQALNNDPALSSGVLPNGMSYYVMKNAEPANRIYLRLVVKAGSILEDDDQKGVAHLVEHMAFNGTAHFAKNQLIDYFESIGMKFGPEVNAYTSFDETVYMLEIPADKRDILLASLDVLKDWAHGITFDQTELDKERGVVVEEWRLGRGVGGRVNDRQIPFLLNGSRYADRLAIGDPEIVKTVSRKRVVDFYEKWYRTDLMSVVVVGDVDASTIAKDLAASVGSVPAPASPTDRPTWDIPLDAARASSAQGASSAPGTGDTLVIRDPEYPYVVVQMLGQHPALRVSTREALRENLAISMAFSALNQRLREKCATADPLMLNAQSGFSQLAKPTVFSFLAFVPATGKFVPAMREAITELERFERFGMTDAELARERDATLNGVEQAWLNRDKAHSADKANAIDQYILYGNTALSIDDLRLLYKEIVPTITKEEISAIVDKYWRKGRGDRLLVIAPESSTDVPVDAELASVWHDWQVGDALSAYSETGLDRPLVLPGSTPAGKIVSEKTLLALSGGDASPSSIKEWKLSNGARVILCPTAFSDNEIRVSAWSRGGYLMASDAEYPSLAISQSYRDLSGLGGFTPTELSKKLAGKTVSAGIWIGESQEGLWGSSSVSDLETLFQLLNLEMTSPSYTAAGWGSLKAQIDKVAEARKADPASMFDDLKVRLLYGNDIRHSTLTPEFVSKIDPAVAEAASRARFANAGDFTFAFAGNFDESLMRTYVETWLAGLPSQKKGDAPKSKGLAFPKGIVTDALSMGIDPKSQVFMAFGGNAKAGKYDPELFSALCQLLDIRLREVVREDMSGSYGVSVDSNFSVDPTPYYEVFVSFGCEPGREASLSDAVIATIGELQAAPVADTYVNKLRENLRRSREEALRTNAFWLERIASLDSRGLPLSRVDDTEEVAAMITGAKLQELAKRYLRADNYVRAYLEPAKK